MNKIIQPINMCGTSFGFSRLFISLSLPRQKISNSKFQSCCRTTCLKVMASMFSEVVLAKISFVIDFFSFIAFSLTFLAGKNSRVEMVLCSSNGPGNMVSTTMAAVPDEICSSAAPPPSAAAAVRACWKSTEPTTVRRAKSFSYVLTAGSDFASDSTIASRSACSEVKGENCELEDDERRREFSCSLNSELGYSLLENFKVEE